MPQAEASYEEARFENVPVILEGCLKTKPTPRQRVEAFALMAKAYVMADRPQAARRAVEELLRADAEFEPDSRRDPSSFVYLVQEVKRESTTIQVASVSKTHESLRKAPATVVVVTAEEIERRGYLDLEAVLHDLPGLNISRPSGATYSAIYPRGFRSDITSRMVLLIDGVEENELWSGIMYLSRQYPLSNIARIELIYGPASTMYGSNAFVGVINVITKEPSEVLKDEKRFGLEAQVTGGEWSTQVFDLTAAGSALNGNVQYTVSGRVYKSDSWDLSSYPEWDFDPSYYDSIDYRSLMGISGTDENGNYLAEQFLQANGLGEHPYYTVERDAAGSAVAIGLTDAGVAQAAALDKALLINGYLGKPVSFGNDVDSWGFHGKLLFSNLVLGFQSWHRDEGADGSYTDRAILGGSEWVINENRFFVKYNKKVSQSLELTYFGRYKEHETNGNSRLPFTVTYETGGLTLLNLLSDTPAFFVDTHFFSSSSEFRNEFNAVFTPTTTFSLVGGIEIRQKSIPGNIVTSLSPNPEETGGLAPPLIPGGNQISSRDVGVYAQASYQPRESFKLVLGGRLDDDKIRRTGGSGTVFNPRLAVIYTRDKWVYKAIYAEAFQDATNFQKFVTAAGSQELPAPNLSPERVKNVELAASWQPSTSLTLDIAGYDARYSGIIQVLQVPCADCSTPETLQFSNAGALRIRGLQLSATYKRDNWDVYGNYTYTDPLNTNPIGPDKSPLKDAAGNDLSELRVGDISTHSANAGFHLQLGDFGGDMRLNYVGERDTGFDTTVRSNPLDRIDSYFVGHLTLTYKLPVEGTRLQLIVNNVLDTEYFDPGARQADGALFASRHPQPRRAIFARLLYEF